MVAQRDDEYTEYAPMLLEYASMAPDDPGRKGLHDQLVTGFLPVAHHVARRFSGRGQPTEDLEQVATIGLLGALRRFDPERGRDFLSFAVPTIMGEVRRHFRDAAWAVRTPRSIKDRHLEVTAASTRLSHQLDRSPTISELATDLGLSRDEVAEAVAARSSLRPSSLDEALLTGGEDTAALADVIGHSDSGLERAEARAMLRDLVAQLPSREQTILALRFIHDRTQSEIGAAVGISQMHVSRLLNRSLTQMREHIDQQLEAELPGERQEPTPTPRRGA